MVSFVNPKRRNGVKSIIGGTGHLFGLVSLSGYWEYIAPISLGGVSRTYCFGGHSHHKDANPDDSFEHYGIRDFTGAVGGRRAATTKLREWRAHLDTVTSISSFDIWNHDMALQPGYLSLGTKYLIEKANLENLTDLMSKVPDFDDLRLWQQKAINIYSVMPYDDRHLMCIVGPPNIGKTVFLRYLAKHHDAQLLTMQRSADIARKIDNLKTTFAFDWAKDFESDKDYQPYNLLEQLKNRHVPNGKYDGTDLWCPPNKIVIVSNKEPLFERLSKDRFVMIYIDEYFHLTLKNYSTIDLSHVQ